jgi:hypothetical protein
MKGVLPPDGVDASAVAEFMHLASASVGSGDVQPECSVELERASWLSAVSGGDASESEHWHAAVELFGGVDALADHSQCDHADGRCRLGGGAVAGVSVTVNARPPHVGSASILDSAALTAAGITGVVMGAAPLGPADWRPADAHGRGGRAAASAASGAASQRHSDDPSVGSPVQRSRRVPSPKLREGATRAARSASTEEERDFTVFGTAILEQSSLSCVTSELDGGEQWCSSCAVS